jgi:hypothetical protein
MGNPNLDMGFEVVKLGNDIQEFILARSNPTSRAPTGLGGISSVASYDVEQVLSGLCWALANFIVQSGEFPTRQARKAAAKTVEHRLITFYPQVERIIGNLTPKPN